MQRIPVLLFPFAGAGAGAFRRCQEYHSEVLRVCPVQLPGREQRFGEPAYTDAAQAVTGLLPDVLEVIGADPEVALFGHSLGAVLAFEMAHRLSKVDGLTVNQVFVSGSPGPWTQRKKRATGLTDDEFLDQVRELAGYSHPALEHPELRELLLPTLRADVALHEDYRPPDDRRLAIPIVSIRGNEDELVSREQAEEWAAATTAGFRLVELPGSHMYLVDSPVELVQRLEGLIATGVGVIR
jgi:surfactin synthase thioesterase subunit